MDLNAVGIPLTFLVLCSMGLWLILYARGSWHIKLAFISICLYFSFLMWHSLSDLSGWCTDSPMPKKSIIHWILVSEPSKSNARDQGNIFFWATEIDENNEIIRKVSLPLLRPFSSKKNETEPRAYRLPYSEDLHEKSAKAMQELMKGKTLIGEKESGGDGSNEGGENGKHSGKSNGGSLSQEQVFRFYELPPFKLPQKITGRDN